MKKRFVSLLLALILVLSFTVPAMGSASDAVYITTINALNALDEAGIVYDYLGVDDSGNEKISMIYELNETEITIDIFFDEDLTSAHLRVWDYIKYDATKFLSVVQACNAANKAYMWTAFYTEDDNTVTVKLDLPVSVIGSGSVIVDGVGHMVSICDAAFASFAPYNN